MPHLCGAEAPLFHGVEDSSAADGDMEEPGFSQALRGK